MPDASVALCVFATGHYTDFLPTLTTSARQNFCPSSNVQIVAMTDQPCLDKSYCDVQLFAPQMPWPLGTLLRYHYLSLEAGFLKQFYYLFMCDADMRFVANVGPEILSIRVATLGEANRTCRPSDFTYCRDPNSTAFIQRNRGKRYYVGGFQGGSSQSYLRDCQQISDMIDTDLSNRIIPVWHDESYWNAYLLRHEPTMELPSTYCSSGDNPKPDAKILALVKDHKHYRRWSKSHG